MGSNLRGSKPGERRGGRVKGTPNKVTLAAKEMLEKAAEGAGGLPALTDFAKTRPEIFWPMWAKLLPKNVAASLDGKLTITIERK